VATTGPSTRASTMERDLASDVVDDAHDGRVDGDEGWIECQRRLAAADEIDEVAFTSLHRVDGDLEAADGLPSLVDGLHEQQLPALQPLVLHGRHDGAAHFAEVHGGS